MRIPLRVWLLSFIFQTWAVSSWSRFYPASGSAAFIGIVSGAVLVMLWLWEHPR